MPSVKEFMVGRYYGIIENCFFDGGTQFCVTAQTFLQWQVVMFFIESCLLNVDTIQCYCIDLFSVTNKQLQAVSVLFQLILHGLAIVEKHRVSLHLPDNAVHFLRRSLSV